MPSSVPWFFWLMPVAVLVHNIEEAIWLPQWSQSAGRFQRPVGAFEFRFALIFITAIPFLLAGFLYGEPRQSIPCYLFFAFNFGMLVNVFIPHLAATFALRRYAPGTLTGLLCILPVTAFLLYYGYQNEYFVFPMFWYVTIPFAAFIVGMIPALFWIGRMIIANDQKTMIDDRYSNITKW